MKCLIVTRRRPARSGAPPSRPRSRFASRQRVSLDMIFFSQHTGLDCVLLLTVPGTVSEAPDWYSTGIAFGDSETPARTVVQPTQQSKVIRVHQSSCLFRGAPSSVLDLVQDRGKLGMDQVFVVRTSNIYRYVRLLLVCTATANSRLVKRNG